MPPISAQANYRHGVGVGIRDSDDAEFVHNQIMIVGRLVVDDRPRDLFGVEHHFVDVGQSERLKRCVSRSTSPPGGSALDPEMADLTANGIGQGLQDARCVCRFGDNHPAVVSRLGNLLDTGGNRLARG